jgi:hypothetical protein
VCPVLVHPDLPGFRYVKGVHWMVLAGAVAERVVADKKGRVYVIRQGYKPRNVTLAAKSLLGRGLVEPWAPGESVWATDLGRTYLARKHPTGHPDFAKVMAARANEEAARIAKDAAADVAARAAASTEQAQDTANEPDMSHHDFDHDYGWPADAQAEQMEPAQ